MCSSNREKDRVSEIGFILYMFVKVWERYRMYKSDVLFIFVYVVFVWERYRMYKWDRICTIHICIRVQVRERERERERESEIEIWQPEGMKILDRIFPIPAIKIKIKEKNLFAFLL